MTLPRPEDAPRFQDDTCWDERVHQNLCAWLPTCSGYAVFDWDNTSIAGDIQEGVLAFQIKHDRWLLEPTKMKSALHAEIPSEALSQTVYAGLTLGEVLKRAARAYATLWELPKEDARREAPRAELGWALFCAYNTLKGASSDNVRCQWIACLCAAGATPEQITELTHDAITWHHAIDPSMMMWPEPEDLPDHDEDAITSRVGLRALSSMIALYKELRTCGVDVWVCSASMEQVVRAFASDPRYGYGVAPERVIGLRPALDEATRRYQPRLEGIATHGSGKARAIEALIALRYEGRGPCLVAGDSEGDVAMMTRFGEDTERVLLADRQQAPSSPIGELCARAFEARGEASSKWLIQGRDERRGVLTPAPRSVLIERA